MHHAHHAAVHSYDPLIAALVTYMRSPLADQRPKTFSTTTCTLYMMRSHPVVSLTESRRHESPARCLGHTPYPQAEGKRHMVEGGCDKLDGASRHRTCVFLSPKLPPVLKTTKLDGGLHMNQVLIQSSLSFVYASTSVENENGNLSVSLPSNAAVDFSTRSPSLHDLDDCAKINSELCLVYIQVQSPLQTLQPTETTPKASSDVWTRLRPTEPAETP